MTRPVAAALLSAALGAWYARTLDADALHRERVCMAALAEAVDALEDSGDTLEVARGRVEWVASVLDAEAGRCSWWARACR